MYPVLVTIFGYQVRSHGVMAALGILLGIWLAILVARRQGRHEDAILDFFFWAVIAGVVGSRLWEVAFTWDYYSARPWEALYVWQGGLSIQGGLVGGVLAGVWFTRKYRINFWDLADTMAPGVILGQGIGRVGCFLDGDTWSVITHGPLGVTYRPGTLASQYSGGQPMYPAEMWEGVIDVLIMGFLLWLAARQKKRRPGNLFLLYAVLYSAARFLLEFIRRDSLVTLAGLKVAQLTSIGVVIVAAFFYWYNRRLPLVDVVGPRPGSGTSDAEPVQAGVTRDQ